MRRIWLTIAFVVLVIVLFTYVYLGGFEEPKITVKETPPTVLAGYAYNGPMNAHDFGQLFRKADSLAANRIVEGKVAGIFYNQPKKGGDHLKAFVGVILNDTSAALPGNLEKRVFEKGKVIEAELNAHYLILPVNIYPRIQEYAEKNKLKVSEKSIEIYESDKKLIIRAILNNQ